MFEYYVSLVKEYLEMQDFVVKTETKYKKKKNWRDIDILAIKIKNDRVVRLIVGEVKGEYKKKKKFRRLMKRNLRTPM